MQARNPKNVKGIDVSHHNGTIDWQKVAQAGIKFVYIKATEGSSYVDSTLNNNYKNAKAAGLKVGFYHFARPLKGGAPAEVKNFVSAVKSLNADLPAVLDVEVSNGLSTNDLSSFTDAWLSGVKSALNSDEIVYTGEFFAFNLQGKFGKYPLWVARYGANQPGDVPGWPKWSIFQYDEHGKVAGIGGDVDMDEMDAAYFNSLFPVTKPKTYTIVDGDTYDYLSQKFGINVSDLERFNPGKKPDALQIGDVINLVAPVKPQTGVLTVLVDQLNVHSSADFNSSVVKVITNGQSFNVYKQTNGLYCISDNMWVSAGSKYVQFTPTKK